MFRPGQCFIGTKQEMKKLVLIGVLILAGHAVLAQNYQTQSVYIFSFTKYILWPEDRNTGDFEILVLGDTPLLTELNAMSEKKKVAGGRAIKVTRINSPSEVKKCHILIIPSGSTSMFAEAITKVADQPVLIVTDQQGMGQKGSSINFVQKEGRMAFEMNQSSLNSRKLKAAIELSRLAIII